MLKILLVDDEFLVRLALENTVDWSANRFEFIGTASNGVEAWERIQKERPDIVITDITMPQMGGLELIEKVRSAQIPCEFIVLSCHNEFDYAKRALKLGVFDYILKLSMNMTELMEILDRLRKKILSERTDHPGEMELELGLSEQQDLMHTQYQVIAVLGEDPALTEREKTNIQIQGFLQQMTGGISRKQIFIYRNTPIILLWEEVSNIKALMADIRTEIEKYLAIGVTIGIGTWVKGNINIKESYECAICACGHRFYRGEKTVVSYKELPYRDACELEFKTVFPGIQDMLGMGIQTEFRDRLILCLEQIQKAGDLEPDKLRMYLHELLTRIKLTADGQKAGIISETMYGDIYRKVNQLEYLEDIKSELIYFTDQILEQFDLIHENELVKKAKRYIHLHLNGDLKVMEVSRHLGVNPDYFSHLFRTETGIRYIDYVNHMRIESACELLRITNDKIYEIGERCGFENTNYFIKVFKKHTGQTPLDYKKSQESIKI